MAIGSHKEPIGKPVDTRAKNPPHGMDAVQ
jgi:hypothetical protein